MERAALLFRKNLYFKNIFARCYCFPFYNFREASLPEIERIFLLCLNGSVLYKKETEPKFRFFFVLPPYG